MTAPEADPFNAYGRILGALHVGMSRAAQSLMAGFSAVTSGWAAAEAKAMADELARLEADARRARIAAFDVDAEQARLDDLGARIRTLADRWAG